VAERPVIIQRQGFGLATIMARKGVKSDAIAEALNIEIDEGPRVCGTADLTLIGTAPETWLAFTATPGDRWAQAIEQRLSNIAAVSEQSGGYVIFSISGLKAVALLRRGAFIDFDPSAFPTGSVATTSIAHLGVIIWRSGDKPTFEVALFRSYAESFREWIASTLPSL